MADSVKQQIVANIKTTLEGLTAANGYNRTVRSVSTTSQSIDEPVTDYIYIATVSEEKTDLESRREVTLQVFLLCIVDDNDDLAKAVHDIAADVEKCLCYNDAHTRGGLAVDTSVVRVEDEVIADLEPLGSCAIELEIVYRHQFGDPYTAA